MIGTRSRRRFVAALGMVLMPILGACSSNSNNANTTSPASASTESGTPAAVTGSGSSSTADGDAAALLAAGYKGTFSAPPHSGPRATAGTQVWVISCGQSAESCSGLANAAVAGGEAAGWHMHLYDAKLNPANYTVGINQALAAGAKGIIVTAADCDLEKAALQQAKAAGAKTVGMLSFDCNDPLAASKSDPLFSTFVKYHNIDTAGEAFEMQTKLKAAWLIAKTDGKAQIVSTAEPGFLISAHLDKGFTDEIATCSGCKILDTVNVSPTDFANNTATSKLQTALQKYTTVNAVHVTNDSFFQQFADAALKSVGYNNLSIVGGECGTAAALAAIRAGGPEQACVAEASDWIGWAAVDELNRQFADPGSAPVDEGLGFQVVDKDHNLPTGSTYQVPVDFKSAYIKVWTGK